MKPNSCSSKLSKCCAVNKRFVETFLHNFFLCVLIPYVAATIFGRPVDGAERVLDVKFMWTNDLCCVDDTATRWGTKFESASKWCTLQRLQHFSFSDDIGHLRGQGVRGREVDMKSDAKVTSDELMFSSAYRMTQCGQWTNWQNPFSIRVRFTLSSVSFHIIFFHQFGGDY